MADTLPNIPLPSNKWVNLYEAASVVVGTRISVENIGSNDVYLAVSPAEPTENSAYTVIKRNSDLNYENTIGDSGAWAFSPNVGGKVNVKIGYSGFSPSIKPPADRLGRESQVSMNGESLVAALLDDISVNFQYGIRTRDVRDGGIASGTGAVGTLKSTAYVETGAGIGAATIQSLASVRYRAGHECFCKPSVIFGTPVEGVNQYAGFLNDDDAWCFGYQGLDFGLWFIEGTNINFITQAEFNIDKLDGTGSSGYNINPQGANVPVMTYTWHGFKDLVAGVDRGDGVIFWCHIIRSMNVATETHLENPNLPISCKVERVSGAGANVRLLTGSWRAGVVGGEEENTTSDSWFNVTILDRTLVGNVRNNIVSVRNKTQYAGKKNHIRVELGIVSFANDANKTIAIYGTINPILTGNSLYSDVDTVNSVLEFSTGGTIAGGSRGPATVLKSGDDRRTDVRNTGIDIYPGQELAIEVDPGGAVNGTFSVSLRFKEYH